MAYPLSAAARTVECRHSGADRSYDYLADQEDLQLVQSALRLSAHIVGRYPRQLAGQLIGRLLGNQTPSILVLLNQAAEGGFLPLKPSLIAPGGPLIRKLEGHARVVSALAITPDGRLALSASDNGTLRLWDLETGQTIGTLEGHSSGVNAVAVMPDARRVVSGSGDGALWLWDLESRKQITAFTGDEAIGNCIVAPDGQTIIARETSGRVHFLQIVRSRRNKALDQINSG
jgi:WD40 repeat protein